MSAIFPFAALRPEPSMASLVASVPYDVVNTEEARALAAGNPLSFLHVSRPEIDLPPGTDPHADEVYARATANFAALRQAAPLVMEDAPAFYVYRLHMGAHTQSGVAACFSVDEYDRDLIRKHEKTRPDKEDDRTRHMLAIQAQTGPVFLTYRATLALDTVMTRVEASEPLFDFTAPDHVRHVLWRVPASDMAAIVNGFADVPVLYIADGHHRAASAARARQALSSRRQRRVGPRDGGGVPRQPDAGASLQSRDPRPEWAHRDGVPRRASREGGGARRGPGLARSAKGRSRCDCRGSGTH